MDCMSVQAFGEVTRQSSRGGHFLRLESGFRVRVSVRVLRLGVRGLLGGVKVGDN